MISIKVGEGSRLDVAAKLLSTGNRLLDIGCKDGTFCMLAKQEYKEIYGVDISEKSLAVAKKRGVKTFRVNLNEDSLPFEDDYFDCVTCLDVIEHVVNPTHLIQETFRVSKRKGVLIISTPNIRHWRHILSLIFGKFPKTSLDPRGYDGSHIHYFTFADLEELLLRHGFIEIEKFGVFGVKHLIEFRSWGVLIRTKKI